MTDEKFLELTVKYLSNESSELERDELISLLKQSNYSKQFNRIKKEWKRAGDSSNTNQFKIQHGFEKLKTKISKYDSGYNTERKKFPVIQYVYRNVFAKSAISIALVLIFSTIGLYYLGVFNTKSNSVVWNEKRTEPGQKSILTLFDGSRITLNAGSLLKYPKQFGTDVREVFIEGEAFFEVKRNESRPFIVRSKNISTTVLGTVFNVKAFPEENQIEISLIEGKVAVHKDNDPDQYILNSSQQFVYEKVSGKEKINEFDLYQTVGWKDDLFKFENEKLENVIKVLERAYGVQIELKEKSLYNKRITTKFNHDSFWTMIKVLKEITGLKFQTIHKDNEVQKVIFYK